MGGGPRMRATERKRCPGPAYPIHCHSKNARVPQEDAHSTVLRVEPSSDAGIFAVFDGHGGKEVAKYAAVHVVGEGLVITHREAQRIGKGVEWGFIKPPQ